jgi:hypothetical protein
MNIFKTLAMVGLVGVGVAYGEDAPKKKIVVTGTSDIGENGCKEVALIEQLKSLERSKVIDKKQFNDHLKEFSDLMVAGRTTSSNCVWMEIGRQTEYFARTCEIWESHPELQDQNTAYRLKSMSESIYALIKKHQIPNYTKRPYHKLSVAMIGIELTQSWKDYVQKNDENGRENLLQIAIKKSLETIDSCTRSLDQAITKKGFDTNKAASASSPTPQMNLFKTLAMVGLVGVGMAYGEDAPKKREVTGTSGIKISENVRKEVAIVKELIPLNGVKPVDPKQFNDLLKRFRDLMIVGSTAPDVCDEIIVQRDFLVRAQYIWLAHPEIQDPATTYQLKGMGEFLSVMLQVHQMPDYKEKPCMGLSGICGVEPSQEWKDYVQKNIDNGHENATQRTIKDSIPIVDMVTRSLDREIAKRSFDTNKAASAPTPTPQ